MKVTTQEAGRSRVFNKLTRLMISTQDFQQALSAATFLLEEVDDGNYEVKGSNSYSKMVARYRQDLLAVHAASEPAQ